MAEVVCVIFLLLRTGEKRNLLKATELGWAECKHSWRCSQPSFLTTVPTVPMPLVRLSPLSHHATGQTVPSAPPRQLSDCSHFSTMPLFRLSPLSHHSTGQLSLLAQEVWESTALSTSHDTRHMQHVMNEHTMASFSKEILQLHTFLL